MPSRIRKNASGSEAKPSTCASGVNGSDRADRGAARSAVTIIGRLGRLRRNGTRRVRITKITSVWVASDSTNQPLRNSLWPACRITEHHEERREVEDRADGPEHGHEAADERDVPGGRAGEHLRRRRCRSGSPSGPTS